MGSAEMPVKYFCWMFGSEAQEIKILLEINIQASLTGTC